MRRQKIRILVVDDHPVFRAGLIRWLVRQPALECCGEAESLAAARPMVADRQPDIVLLDISLGDGNGLELARELTAAGPRPAVIVLSQNREDDQTERAFLLGARGYVMKSEATEVILTAIQTVLRGELYLTRRMAARLHYDLRPRSAHAGAELGQLTDREQQVFQLVGAGCATGEIAERLGISPKTVDTYREHLKDKLGLADGAALSQAAAQWVESGQLALG